MNYKQWYLVIEAFRLVLLITHHSDSGVSQAATTLDQGFGKLLAELGIDFTSVLTIADIASWYDDQDIDTRRWFINQLGRAARYCLDRY